MKLEGKGLVATYNDDSSGLVPWHYDVFDATARLHAEAHLRARSRIVGFGDGVIYVARRDADDLEHLERYRR